MYVFRLITLVNVLFSNKKIPVNNGIHSVCRMLTCLVNVGKRLFSRVNCEGKLSDNGTNTCIHWQENTGKTSDYLFAKHWKMHAKYRVFGEFTIHFPNGECNVFCRESLKKSPKKTPKKNKDKMDDISDPVAAKRSLWKDESLKAIHDLFKEEISTQNIALSTFKEKIKSYPILHQESPRRVYDRIRLELRKENQNASSIGEPLALPMETEAVESRINRMFEETCSQSSDIMPPTDTTEKSKGVFSAEQAKVLVDLFKDMIKGAPISKPVITTRLQGESMTKTLFKDCTIAQVVNRLKYERKQNYKRVCESNK